MSSLGKIHRSSVVSDFVAIANFFAPPGTNEFDFQSIGRGATLFRRASFHSLTTTPHYGLPSGDLLHLGRQRQVWPDDTDGHRKRSARQQVDRCGSPLAADS